MEDTLIEGICGGAGGCVGRICGFPFDALRTLSATNPDFALKDVNPLELYRGVSYSAFEAFVGKGVNIAAFAKLKEFFRYATPF